MEKRKERLMEIKRRPFQGVLNILDFNRHFYYYGIGALILLIAIAYALKLPSIITFLLIAGFAYGLLMPLIVSAYVYDFSGYYSMKWLDQFIEDKSLKFNLVNINAGFDETSFILKDKLKNGDLQVFDFYNEEHHTEPAIVRARKVSLVYPNTTQIDFNAIPLADNSTDIVFLLSAAHEIREQSEKVEFLKECARICKPDGKIIMVEHLRDFPNFVAFTIGFNHFFSNKVWRQAFDLAGFKSLREEKFTPFMSIYECKP